MADISSNTNWSETDASNSSTPPNGWPAGMQPNQVEPTARAEMGAMKRFWNRANFNYTTTGSGGAYVLTPSNTSYPSVYVQGERFAVKANFTSIGGDTLNINALGALPIYKFTGAGAVAVASGDIQANAMVEMSYDAALNGGSGGFQLTTTPIASGIIPSGSVMPYAATAAPSGWLLCNGAAVSRTTYAALFAAISTSYGTGDGSTTFNVPDCRGRFLAGYDPSNATGRLNAAVGGSMSAAALANVGGEQYHVLSGAELAAHAHGVNDPTHVHGVGDPTHAHGVADPTHAHGVADPQHIHGVGDPGHGHGVADPSHSHNFPIGNSIDGAAPGIIYLQTVDNGGNWYTSNDYTGIGIDGSGTGVYLGYAATGIGIYGAYTGIGIDASGTGIYLGYSGTGISIQNAGSSSAHNNVPPGIIVNYIIKI